MGSMIVVWARSSAGRAPGLHPGGRRFEPGRVHHDFLSETWAYSSVWLERTPDKREVGGSNPPRPTSFFQIFEEKFEKECEHVGLK